MKAIPIHVIVAGMRRKKTLEEQIDYLLDWVSQEPLRSVRRNELESLLQGKRTKQLRREVTA